MKEKTDDQLRKMPHTKALLLLLALHSPARSLGFTIWGEIFVYVTVF